MKSVGGEPIPLVLMEDIKGNSRQIKSECISNPSTVIISIKITFLKSPYINHFAEQLVGNFLDRYYLSSYSISTGKSQAKQNKDFKSQWLISSTFHPITKSLNTHFPFTFIPSLHPQSFFKDFWKLNSKVAIFKQLRSKNGENWRRNWSQRRANQESL